MKKLNSTLQTILTCAFALCVTTFLINTKDFQKNGLLIELILGIFMTIGIWRTIKPHRKYKYSNGLAIAVQVAIFGLLGFVILGFALTFFLAVFGSTFRIEAILNYLNTFIAKFPSVLISAFEVAPLILILMFTIPTFFLLTNRNKEVWED